MTLTADLWRRWLEDPSNRDRLLDDLHDITSALHDDNVDRASRYLPQIGGPAGCRNCDDRRCMSCVLRRVHDDCVDDCPGCCSAPISVGVGVRRADMDDAGIVRGIINPDGPVFDVDWGYAVSGEFESSLIVLPPASVTEIEMIAGRLRTSDSPISELAWQIELLAARNSSPAAVQLLLDVTLSRGS